jgi:chitinase
MKACLLICCAGFTAALVDPDITKCQNYTVVAGDFCSKIATKFGTDVAHVTENGKPCPAALNVGDVLLVCPINPAPPPAPPTPGAPTPPPTPKPPLPDVVFGAYSINWAHYRAAPHTYAPASLTGSKLVTQLQYINHAFAYFCPGPMLLPTVPPWGKAVCTAANPYALFFNDPKDVEFMATYKSLKLANPGLRVALSVGGWGFPSAYFSEMAANPAGVTAFVASVKAFLAKYELDGIDIDWEFPNSVPR